MQRDTKTCKSFCLSFCVCHSPCLSFCMKGIIISLFYFFYICYTYTKCIKSKKYTILKKKGYITKLLLALPRIKLYMRCLQLQTPYKAYKACTKQSFVSFVWRGVLPLSACKRLTKLRFVWLANACGEKFCTKFCTEFCRLRRVVLPPYKAKLCKACKT